jgi:hypothetical protein
MLKKIHTFILFVLKLERAKDYNKLCSEIAKLELERSQLLEEHRTILFSFKSLVATYNAAQLNALYYEMIAKVRNDGKFRHLLPIWFGRMKNAIETFNKDLLNEILAENELDYKKTIQINIKN